MCRELGLMADVCACVCACVRVSHSGRLVLAQLRAAVWLCLCTGLEGRVRPAVGLCGGVCVNVYSRAVCCWLNNLFLLPRRDLRSLELEFY